MQIEQVIGGVNGDTTAQAVQLRMRFTGQNLVNNAHLIAVDAAGNNPITLATFPSNVTNSAAGSRILITTSSFASHESTPITADFTMIAIPPSYLAAGRLMFEKLGIRWSVSWGGAGYTGSNTGTMDNDADGNFGPRICRCVAFHFDFCACLQRLGRCHEHEQRCGLLGHGERGDFHQQRRRFH